MLRLAKTSAFILISHVLAKEANGAFVTSPMHPLTSQAASTRITNTHFSPISTHSSPSLLPLRSTNDEKEEETEPGMRSKLLAESIAPWRTLRVFLCFSLASGAILGGLITASGVAAALSGARPDVELNTEYVNVAIDFGAALIFGIAAKLDLDKGAELNTNVEEKLEKKKSSAEINKEMEERAKELSKLSLSIRVSPDPNAGLTEATVSALQNGAKQHMIIVAGPRKVIKDALFGANLLKLEDFAMSNVLVVPYEVETDETAKIKPSGGFAERPAWETKTYVANVCGDGWDNYIETEMKSAVEQGGEDAREQGIAIVVSNNGKVIRRGVGMVPWRQMVQQLTEIGTEAEK
eukprot:CAMPEP_0195513504 /NCGR_PEP_ID=MMETSP0794_2-20130614/5146_1 /TAXON_ID=515487 /ORGANISM="Stephanopyxis turris, Strain CCMP 815" /LENGTH=350 /DNA_ID=CAMNT_0040641537 /DNA_START=115 /DNA_END=1167 /DNA_ORIENTATION=-